MRDIVLIAHNLRSVHNVGSLLRTADGLGVTKVYLTGYTPHPGIHDDPRLPHEIQKTAKQINKTALGAELSQPWEYAEDVGGVIASLHDDGYTIVGIEQVAHSVPLYTVQVRDHVAIIAGREVEGIEPEVIGLCDLVAEIPMYGQKESFNVVQAAAMALYHFRFN